MREKQKILSKLNIKDYISDLELILEGKTFDEEAKSLLLSIFYKLDNFYKDYSLVKKQIDSKSEYLEKYINIIKNKCNRIEIIKPRQLENNEKYIVDRKSGTIKCVPNEIILLYALQELTEKYVVIDRYVFEDFTKICVNDILNKGKTINELEPIRDFNGWSWNVQIDNTDNIVYNLIFQNLLLLLDYKFVYENFSKSNIVEILEKKLKTAGYGEAGKQFLSSLIEICVILYNNQSNDNHAKCLKYKKRLNSKKSMLNNRRKQLESTAKNSSVIDRKIQEIDEMLNDINLLREEYTKCIENNKKAYFGIGDFIECKEKEKQDLLKKIKSNDKEIGQKQYLSEHDDYATALRYYAEIQEDKDKVNVQAKIVRLQQIFLECLKIKIVKTEAKKDLSNLIKEIRYYSNVLYKKNTPVMLEEKVAEELENVVKDMVCKIVENKIIETGFKSKELNYKILKYIFETKIIELENLVIKIKFTKSNKIQVEYYDSKLFDHKEIYEIPFDEEITSKKDRKIKLLKIGG
ncbi:MAG: hypothetical protein IKD76_04855 [Clostridia bacterium]|nr:hypothetical protein [Clostridia bacterium]